MVTNALDCFASLDQPRIIDTFEHLLPYLTTEEFAVVGGLAIRYYVAEQGQSYPSRPFNDLDIIIKHQHTLDPQVTEHFKIAHFHKTAHEYYFAIVDPVTRIKVDIFQWPAVDMRTTEVPLGTHQVPLQSIENQLAKTILDTTKVLDGGVVDPKQFSDALLLQPAADPDKTSAIFTQLYGQRLPTLSTATVALEAAQATARQHPELVKEKPFHKPKPYQCTECVDDPQYPLTPLTEIYRLLGYIE